MPTLYDTVRYPSRTYTQTHPARIGVVAALFGLQPTPPRSARVLEMGCGDGANLLAMAEEFPEATFVGVDLSEAAIADGRGAIRETGLSNISLLAADITKFEPEKFGPFDYILSHGVLSWIPAPARDALLACCGRALAPHGIAYISYNAYPGCHMREMTRMMMRFHVRDMEDPQKKIDQGRVLLRTIGEAFPGAKTGYHHVIEELFGHARDYPDATFFHDDLSEINTPFYLHEFVAMAETHGLQYLAEADIRAMRTRDVAEPARRILAGLEDINVVMKEQYLDFFRGSTFRQSLVCRADAPVTRPMNPAAITGLWLASDIQPSERDPDGPADADYYIGPNKEKLMAHAPEVKDAVRTLAAAWPESRSFADLTASIHDPVLIDRLTRFFLEANEGGVVEIRTEPVRCRRDPGEFPRVGAVARRQARTESMVTTRRHTRIRLDDDATRLLVHLMDGTRDRDALCAALHEAWANQAVTFEKDGTPLTTPEEIDHHLRATINSQITTFAREGLLGE